MKYQFQAVRQALGAAFGMQELETEIGRLEKQPAGAAETTATATRFRRELWQSVARNRPEGIPTRLAAALVGLR